MVYAEGSGSDLSSLNIVGTLEIAAGQNICDITLSNFYVI
jgi:hypothetical protein